MKEKSIKKNYALNLIYELFALLVPIFVMPYVSRVLSANGVGVYSYTYSIVYYFMLLGGLGFTTYARRELSKLRDKKEEKYGLFWEVTITKLITCVISAIVYEIVIVSFFYNTYYFIFLQSIIIYILGTSLDIIYYYQAQEDFEKIVYRNIFIKVIGVILIFIFVKKTSDLYLYIIIQAAIFALSSLLLWIALPRDIYKISKSKLNLKRHIKPALKLFIPTVASSVYTILDKTIIGMLVTETTTIDGEIVRVSDIEIGVYEQVEKLVKMATTVLTSLSTIVSPRNSYYFAKKQFDKIKHITYKTYSYVMMLALPMIFGIFLISEYFCPMFLGAGYDKAPYLMNILAILILFIGVSGIFGMQYLTAIGEDTKYITAVVVGAITNLVLNLILIPYLYSYGAAIATVIAEFIILILLIYYSRKIISIKQFLQSLLKYLIGAAVMFVVASFLKFTNPVVTLAVRVITSIIIYGLYLILIKDHILLDVTKTILRVLKRGGKSNNEY